MPLPDVNLRKTNGGLGRQKPTDDGISGFITQGVAIAGKLELGKVYELRSIEAAQALGLSAASTPLPYRHISEYFRLGPGAVLLFMMVPRTVTLAEICDRTLPYAKKMLVAQNGRVKQLAVSLNPAAGYAPVIAAGLDSDVYAAVAKAQALAAEEYIAHRPVFVAVAGHGFSGAVADLTDARTLGAEYVSVLLGTDALFPKEPAIGSLLGILSAAQVHLDIGWVDAFPLAGDGSFLNGGLSDGTANEDLLPGDLGAAHDKGYIVVMQHPGTDGFFFSDSPTCTVATSDYCQIENVRTSNTATTVIRTALLPQLKGPLRLQADGTLQPQVLTELEGKARTALEVSMSRKGELSDFDVYIDPTQKLASGTVLEVKFLLLPVGVARQINGTIGFATSLK